MAQQNITRAFVHLPDEQLCGVWPDGSALSGKHIKNLFTDLFQAAVNWHHADAAASPSDDGARQPQGEYIDADTAKQLRSYLWLGHGHQGQYGDDGEMQCSACAPIWDYRRAPLADVIQQAVKARQEVNMAALFKQIGPPAAASDDGAARPQPAQEKK